MARSAKAEDPLVGYLEHQLEMKSLAGMSYEIFGTKLELFQKIIPGVTNVTKISADVWLWTCVGGGSWKIKVECIEHEQTKSVAWTWLDKEAPKKLYKTLKVDYEFSPTDKGCKAKVKLIFEKKDITVPDPKDYMDFTCDLLVAAANNAPKH